MEGPSLQDAVTRPVSHVPEPLPLSSSVNLKHVHHLKLILVVGAGMGLVYILVHQLYEDS